MRTYSYNARYPSCHLHFVIGVTHLIWHVELGNKLKKFGNHCPIRIILLQIKIDSFIYLPYYWFQLSVAFWFFAWATGWKKIWVCKKCVCSSVIWLSTFLMRHCSARRTSQLLLPDLQGGPPAGITPIVIHFWNPSDYWDMLRLYCLSIFCFWFFDGVVMAHWHFGRPTDRPTYRPSNRTTNWPNNPPTNLRAYAPIGQVQSGYWSCLFLTKLTFYTYCIGAQAWKLQEKHLPLENLCSCMQHSVCSHLSHPHFNIRWHATARHKIVHEV